jgi:hypothetical protein
VQQRSTISNSEPQAAEDEHTSDDFDAIREANEDDMGDMTSVTQDAAEREFSKSVKIPEKRQKLDHLGENLLTLFKSSKETEEDADRSFLLSLLPHIKGFNEDQKLVFQSEVLQLIMQIKRGNYPPITPSAPSSGNIQYAPYS